MSHAIIGYGEYKGYQLSELPEEALADLVARYPLLLNGQARAEYDELVITVAVHAEIQRRASGGKLEKRVPPIGALAEEIVTLGFQQASRHHHPDGKGDHEAQIRLAHARDELRTAARNL